MNKEELGKHEVKCSFREVPCPLTTCEKMILFSSFDTHISKNHKDTLKLKLPCVKAHLSNKIMEEENRNWVIFQWTDEHGNIFYLQLLKRGGLWYYWIKTKSDPTIAATYEVKAEVHNKETEFKMMYMGPVHPIDMPVQEVLRTGHYLLMNRQNIERLKMSRGAEQVGEDGLTDELILKFAFRNVNNS